MGHEVVEFEFDLTQTFRNLDAHDARQAAFIAKNRPAVSGELLRQVRAAHGEKPVDMFFSYFYDTCVLPGVIDEIRGDGDEGGELVLQWEVSVGFGAGDFAALRFLPGAGEVSTEGLRGDGSATDLLPGGGESFAIYKPYEVAKEYDVTFVGQAYGDRPLFLRYLLEHGINVHLWGHGWREPHPRYVPKETYARSSAIPGELRQ